MLAKSMIDSGMVDRAIVGAVEVSLEPGALMAWRALRVLSNEPMIPFSNIRSGINLAEGAAFMLIESDNSANDWAKPSNRIIAAHASTGGWHLTRPDVDKMADLMKKACEIANHPLSDISHLNSHGTGTVANNECESTAIMSVFESEETFPEISATKTYHGHMLAASAAVETVLLLHMIRNNMKIPIINTTSNGNSFFPRPPLRQTDNSRLLMKTAYGFGGTNGCLILQMDDT
jgi:3-oxoacyl-(acyl-carrier-protein) synthase